MKPKKIEVVWEDHHENNDWTEPTDEHRLAPQLIRTRGFLVQENDQMIEVARDIYVGGEGIGSPLRIMKKCIVKRSDRRA